jgi:hypothetical protein
MAASTIVLVVQFQAGTFGESNNRRVVAGPLAQHPLACIFFLHFPSKVGGKWLFLKAHSKSFFFVQSGIIRRLAGRGGSMGGRWEEATRNHGWRTHTRASLRTMPVTKPSRVTTNCPHHNHSHLKQRSTSVQRLPESFNETFRVFRKPGTQANFQTT